MDLLFSVDLKNVIGIFLIVTIAGCLMFYNWTWILGMFWLVQPIITPLTWYHVVFPGEIDPTALSLGSSLVIWVLSSILNIKTGNMVTDLHDWWVDKRGCINQVKNREK